MQQALSYEEAFKCMREFLEIYYQNTHSDDISDVLSDTQMSFWKDGSTADPASWGEWLKCIEKVLGESKKEDQ